MKDHKRTQDINRHASPGHQRTTVWVVLVAASIPWFVAGWIVISGASQ